MYLILRNTLDTKMGTQGGVYAQGVALSKISRRVRHIAYARISARDWGVEMAYFAYVTPRRHSHMDTIRMYLRDRLPFWISLRGINNCLVGADYQLLFNAVFNGGVIEVEYMDNAYVQYQGGEGP